jgi:hypothetical protein
MGTRGLNGWVVDGNVYASYNQYDTYPSGLGRTAVEYVNQLVLNRATQATRDQVRALRKVNDGDKPAADEMAALQRAGRADGNVSSGDDWYSALRNNQGSFSAILETGFILDSADFAADSLFCEYAYLVNLDNETLEVYKGFVSEGAQVEGRFADIDTTNGSNGYAPITLVDTIPFAEIADGASLELLHRMERAVGYEEDDLSEE